LALLFRRYTEFLTVIMVNMRNIRVWSAPLLLLFGLVSAHAEISAASLEDYFGIYVLNKERRSAQDKIVVKGGSVAEISYWRSLQSRDPSEEICNAYKWLLFGRGKYSHGAADAFNQYPALSQIQLVFFDVENGTKLGKKRAEILPTSRIIPYLKIGVERRSLLSKNLEGRTDTQLTKEKCADLGARYLDSRWFDEGYLKQGK
jgi:hypothetical protein